jgi:hypothetical protein
MCKCSQQRLSGSFNIQRVHDAFQALFGYFNLFLAFIQILQDRVLPSAYQFTEK